MGASLLIDLYGLAIYTQLELYLQKINHVSEIVSFSEKLNNTDLLKILLTLFITYMPYF